MRTILGVQGRGDETGKTLFGVRDFKIARLTSPRLKIASRIVVHWIYPGPYFPGPYDFDTAFGPLFSEVNSHEKFIVQKVSQQSRAPAKNCFP